MNLEKFKINENAANWGFEGQMMTRTSLGQFELTICTKERQLSQYTDPVDATENDFFSVWENYIFPDKETLEEAIKLLERKKYHLVG